MLIMLLSLQNVTLTCVFIKGHMYQFHMARYPIEKVSWYLYTLFMNGDE